MKFPTIARTGNSWPKTQLFKALGLADSAEMPVQKIKTEIIVGEKPKREALMRCNVRLLGLIADSLL